LMVEPPRIVNILATCDLGCRVELGDAAVALSTLGRVAYEPGVFPGLVVRVDGVGVLVFATGRIVIAGAKSIEQARRIAERVSSTLSRLLDKPPREVKLQIQNIVAHCSLGHPVNLWELKRRVPTTLYTPDRFPGLIWRLGFGKPVVLVFASGQLIIAGAKSEKDIHEAYNTVKRAILENRC